MAGLAAGGSSATHTGVVIPAGTALGSYFVCGIADDLAAVAESSEANNLGVTAVPMLIELPPPSDLQVTAITVPETAKPGEPVSIEWTVTNASQHPASGRWSDSVFFSTDAAWNIGDRAVGRVEFTGTLAPGASYSSTLRATLPSLTPGSYCVIVRTSSTRSTRRWRTRTTSPPPRIRLE